MQVSAATPLISRPEGAGLYAFERTVSGFSRTIRLPPRTRYGIAVERPMRGSLPLPRGVRLVKHPQWSGQPSPHLSEYGRPGDSAVRRIDDRRHLVLKIEQ